MDNLTVTEQLAAPPLSSVEKLDAALAGLAEMRGEDTAERLLLTTLRTVLPSLRHLGFIPEDADELDGILLGAARMVLGLRSDTAWQPETLDELFLGPETAPDALQGADDASA